MKKLVMLFVLLCSPVFAATDIEIGPQVSSITYEEPKLMKESGMMYGVAGEVTTYDKWLFSLQGRALWGQVDYSSPTSGTIDGIKDSLYEVRGLVGHTFPLKPFGLDNYPFLGIGYRKLTDDISGLVSSEGHLGFERESNYLYMPIGIILQTKGESWKIKLIGEVDAFLGGRQINHFEDIGFETFTNKQEEGFGQKLSLKFEKKTPKFSITAGPYLHHWNIRRSNTAEVTSLPGLLWIEPKNESLEVGVNVSILF